MGFFHPASHNHVASNQVYVLDFLAGLRSSNYVIYILEYLYLSMFNSSMELPIALNSLSDYTSILKTSDPKR